ncbi:MAG: anti-sigma factor family protein [Solirubrobacterales bacterium]
MELTWRRLNFHRDHHWAGPRLSRYVDGDLRPRQQRRLARHEGLCPECRRAIRQLRRLVATLPGLRQQTPAPDIAERTAQAVRMRIEREPPPPD